MIQDSRRSKTAAQLSPTMKCYLSGVYCTESYLCGLHSFCILRFPGYFFFLFTCNLNIICPVFASKTNKNKAYQNCKNFKLTQINDAFHCKPINSLIPPWVLPWKNISLASFFISISFPFGNPFMQARKPNIRLSRVFASRSVVVHTVYCLRWKWQECTRLKFPDIL